MNKSIGLFAAALGLIVSFSSALAGSATWLANPGSGNWNSASNWTPGGPPNGLADLAIFDSSTISNPSLSANTQVGSITFNASGGLLYTITASPTFTLTLSGSGITNNSGLTQNFVAADNNGVILFANGASAGLLTAFTINGGAVSGAFGGTIKFFNSATAGSGVFTNNGGNASNALGGVTQFFDSSSAGNGMFTVNGGTRPGGPGALLEFFGDSTADQGTFAANGGALSGVGGGTIHFHDSSTAGSAAFTSSGCTANWAGVGYTQFHDNSTAGNATFTTNGGATTGLGGGGFTLFVDNSNAGSAHFTTNGSTQLGGGGGTVQFRDTSSAGSGTFITNGSAFRYEDVCPPGTICEDYPPPAGRLGFLHTTTAADATLVAHSGMDGGDGGVIYFANDATGGTARVAVFGNSNLDVNNHNSPGVTIGSLEGDGIVFLGGNNLIVGSNNSNTSFSGIVQDGRPGGGGGTGGSLTKIGTGTLTLSGANTYTGATTINAGKLEVDGFITSAVTVHNGGTLGGSGTTLSATVNSGGIVAPGGSQTLHINGNYAQNAGGLLKIEVAGNDPSATGRLDITGSAALDGTLEVRFLNGFLPVSGQVIRILDVDGALAGSFAQIIFPDLRAGFQFQAEFVSGSYQITALNDGVAAVGFLNIATRMRVGTGDSALIGGFIVTGSASKRVIIRAIGPSLAPLPGRLADPTLELRDNAGALLLSNDNWVESPQAQEIIDSTIPPSDDLEAAIVATLAPGSYTAIMRGANNGTGIGVVELYDLATNVPASLANISSRGLVETGDNVMIGGFIVDNQASPVIVRAIGPSLTPFGIPNALADPTLTLHNGDGAIVAFNDDWQETNQAAIEATGIPPTNDKESAILATLAPGPHTAIVRGLNDTTGVGLVEVYDLQ